ncbi:MAG: helix-turn-helix domain-containing protein [Conexivisphaerales archaeon]
MSETACMIEVSNRKICLYPSEKIIKLLGKEYTILIVGFLGNRAKSGFSEIKKNVGNPSSNLLSHRLHEMEETGLISRYVVNTRPVSVEYSLTGKGKELRRLLIPVFKWLETVQV